MAKSLFSRSRCADAFRHMDSTGHSAFSMILSISYMPRPRRLMVRTFSSDDTLTGKRSGWPVGWLELLVEKPIDRSQEREPKGEVGVVVIGILDQCPMSTDGRRFVDRPAEVGRDDRVG